MLEPGKQDNDQVIFEVDTLQYPSKGRNASESRYFVGDYEPYVADIVSIFATNTNAALQRTDLNLKLAVGWGHWSCCSACCCTMEACGFNMAAQLW